MTKTIVLVHGAFVNADSWDGFSARYQAAGYTVVVPGWPGEVDRAADQRASPGDPGKLGITEIVDHYADVIRSLPEPPILIGHSYGGLFVQLLMQRGLGAAGVAIHPAPPRGVFPSMRAIGSSLPATFGAGGGKHTTVLSPEAFAKNFANGAPQALARSEWERTAVPTPTRIFRQTALFSAAGRIDWDDDERAPLLIVSGSDDRTVTPHMNFRNYRKYDDARATTEYLEFEGRSHATCFEPGWERVADEVLRWAERVTGL